MASLDRLAATPATATYGADVTKELLVWLTAALVVFALLAVVGVVGMFTSENWCLDRHPWWGPPESGSDPTCNGP